jgi:error-prone DNA polymerase
LAGGQKGRPVYDLDEVAAALRDRVVVLTGCRKGHVRAALAGGVVANSSAASRVVKAQRDRSRAG